ncbi:MAG: hypothetical protein KatS3mg076_1822 [Candidatus Binatia bacterium]|nr:MAG: hypothetical protein KatS3mg076_1822 [Candidatus Binatia bacterium]
MTRGVLESPLHEVPDDPEEFLAFAEARGWGDGLPLVPPTAERVQAMLEYVPGTPDTVVGIVEPRRGVATLEKIAVNAVMAGCLPEYFPVVVAAVEAACDPRFNLYALATTTCSATPAVLVNGPVRREIGVECGYSCLGTAGRANATIGRALRLVLRNVGGAVPGAVSKSTFGQPGRISLCFGEWEEKSPWAPFHVRRGFRPEDSVVTLHCATGTQDIADVFAESGEELLLVLAHSIDWVGNNKVLVPQREGEILLLLCPDFAHKIARDGFGVEEAQRFLHEHTKTPVDRWPRGYWKKFEERGYVEDGRVPLCASPEQFLLAVAGGEGGHHAINFCTFGLTWSVSRKVVSGAEACELPRREGSAA